ncbi:MAG: threonine synthase [Rhodospirillales bacterium]
MIYVSTRGGASGLAFDDVVLAGLARDGGLYLPTEWPRLSAAEFRDLGRLSYPHLAARLLALFARPVIDEATLAELCERAYARFDHQPDVAPLRPVAGDDNLWLLELFHGPTLSFKDYALQILGPLFDLVLARRGERITIVGATSGDTGSAAIEACRDRAAIDIFMLHPTGRVSEVQRRQMTTVDAANVHNLAVDGTFDDCQGLVKALFNDAPFRDRYRLAAVNSINWARIAAQITYYVHAALQLGAPERIVNFAVPTGNFGNVFAAWAARQMGLPISRLIIGSNRNDILTRFFSSGTMEKASVHATLSPSMDIQVSSNFERYLFELYDRDATAVGRMMDAFRDEGVFAVDEAHWRRALRVFAAHRLDDAATTEVMRSVYADTGMLIDPHTAIGVAAARAQRKAVDGPIVAVATAHPAKFPEAVEAATGMRPSLPPGLADLLVRPEHCRNIGARVEEIEGCIAAALGRRGSGGQQEDGGQGQDE